MNIHLMSEQERTEARIPRLRKAIREADADKRRVMLSLVREDMRFGFHVSRHAAMAVDMVGRDVKQHRNGKA